MGPASVAHSLDPCITLEKVAYPLLRTQNLLKSLSTKEAFQPLGRGDPGFGTSGGVGSGGEGSVELRSDCHKPRRAYEVIPVQGL